MPQWATVALAATLGLASYAVIADGAYALTQRIDPSLGTLERNRYIAGVAGALGGIALGLKHPILGVAVAGGALAASFGAKLTFLLGEVFDVKYASGKNVAGYDSMQAVYGQNMQGYAEMGAVYGQNMLGMGAVYGQNMQGMGDPGQVAPWSQRNPFGY